MSANISENDLPPWVPPTPSGTANSPGKAVNVPNTPAEEVEKVAPPTVIANKRNANVGANANGNAGVNAGVNAGANNNDGVARALSFPNEEETGDQSNEPQDGGSRKRRARKSKSKKAKKSRKAKSKKSKKNVRRN